MMKKVFLILVAVIGLGISALALSNLIPTSFAGENLGENKSNYPDRCDNCICPRCGGGVGFSARAYTLP